MEGQVHRVHVVQDAAGLVGGELIPEQSLFYEKAFWSDFMSDGEPADEI